MIVPFRPVRKPKEKIRHLLIGARDSLAHNVRKIPSRRYAVRWLGLKSAKAKRRARYLLEDAAFGIKRLGRHTEMFLFGALVLLALAMLFGSTGEGFLTKLIALLLLVLIVVIYGQLRMQKRLIRQYVPMIGDVRIRKCQLYSPRLRLVNLYAAKDKIAQMKKVRNVAIRYDVINDSFAPLSIEGASLTIMMKGGRKLNLPASVSVMDVEPKRTSGTDVSFQLGQDVDFDSIKWMELDIRGNCSKKLRIAPHLYANVVLREKVPRFIFEPFGKFVKRPELTDESVMPESK